MGTVRPRSPQTLPPSTSNEHHNTFGDAGKQPIKRARKAINCEPCRTSKLKCDRNRPCSSCVLRGTASQCYQDTLGNETQSRGVDNPPIRIDAAQEIATLRKSISLLEAHIFPNQRSHAAAPVSSSSFSLPKQESESADHVNVDNRDAIAILTNEGGGLYAGPTSAVTHLMSDTQEFDDRKLTHDHQDEFSCMQHEYDRDLVHRLPPIEVIDRLVNYYFEYCNWIYRHVNQPAFVKAWDRFKNGQSSDRIVLATVCVIMAVAIQYLPAQHPFLQSMSETNEELGYKYYDIMRTAMARHSLEARTYSMEFVELLLLRCHFQTLCKSDSEEIWKVTGEVVTVALAMGLHRDPEKWRMSREMAERRRWGWWHIILLERWQAFMFGRPPSIASHHFDTQLPSYCDPALDSSGRLYLPNITLFRLAYILGDIMNDAVSLRLVPYSSVLDHDRTLSEWLLSMPRELDLDEYHIARALASDQPSIRRTGVQSIIIRTSFYHIRFTLHRPYTTAGRMKEKSLESAIAAADSVIALIGQTRPDFLANRTLNVPGHMSWGPFHVFSAAMFFSFQLIRDPDQPHANRFRSNIAKALSILDNARDIPIANKAYNILDALSPLCSAEYSVEQSEERERKKAAILRTVRKLAFPYHDSPKYLRTYVDSPNTRGSTSSPANSMSSASPTGFSSTQNVLAPVSSMRDSASNQQPISSLTSSIYSGVQHYMPPSIPPQQSSSYIPLESSYQSYGAPHSQQINDDRPYFTNEPDETWGASVGFGPGEWSSLLDTMQRPPSGNAI